MNVLAITAHPDDLEIGCAGTLLKLQAQGANIDSLVLVKPSAEVRAGRNKQTVKQELVNSYAQSGFGLDVFDTPTLLNGRPNLTVDVNTITQVIELLKRPFYDLVLLPSPEDSHQDHRAAYEIGLSVINRRAGEIWLINSWPYCLRNQTTKANVVINISDQWDKKVNLINCYNSYVTAHDVANIETQNRWYGSMLGVSHAEAYEFRFKSKF
jgi:LmbE family N-acetylglucosaminyl deacetylase